MRLSPTVVDPNSSTTASGYRQHTALPVLQPGPIGVTRNVPDESYTRAGATTCAKGSSVRCCAESLVLLGPSPNVKAWRKIYPLHLRKNCLNSQSLRPVIIDWFIFSEKFPNLGKFQRFVIISIYCCCQYFITDRVGLILCLPSPAKFRCTAFITTVNVLTATSLRHGGAVGKARASLTGSLGILQQHTRKYIPTVP